MKIKVILAALMLGIVFPQAAFAVKKSDFICNNQEFRRQYRANKAEWDAAFAFLSRKDLDTLKVGEWHQLTDRTRARVQLTTTRKEGKWEVHRNVIDVFFVLDGTDVVGMSALEDLRECVREWNEKTDAGLYKTSAFPRYAVLKPGKGVILFPSDGHSPNLCEEDPAPLRLVVVKVPYNGQAGN